MDSRYPLAPQVPNDPSPDAHRAQSGERIIYYVTRAKDERGFITYHTTPVQDFAYACEMYRYALEMPGTTDHTMYTYEPDAEPDTQMREVPREQYTPAADPLDGSETAW